ncbi:YDG domain-containing protein [Pseudoduganella sp. UC29_71]|uniref:YDG domain-containing protein n=1 Tax=Pseudoduganella sp. UC29_71 TaxID=3350174 RepID=UPI00367052E4
MMTGPVHQGMRRKLLAVLVAACYGSAYGNPSAPQVVAGQASFLQQGNLFTITNTPNTIINWQNFSVNANEITRFIQQSGDSKVLNRIVGQDPTQILGALQSNGKVFLINPNGVLFGKDARIDVNGLVASSLAISNSDFLAGKHSFSGDGAGKVVNQGSITTPGGGQVYLIGSSVENSGVITSPQGDVVLAAGKSVQLVDSANPDVHVVVSAPADQALNLGQVLAAGGKVGIYGALVNQRGRVNADSAVVGANGKIVLKASGTTLLEAGSRTSANNSAGQGGEIQLLGERVGLTGDAAVDASGAAGGGTVLIGGDYQGKNAAVQKAQQTHIAAGASVRADATASGDGGKIIAWSDGATRVFGSLSARGGAQGGNGGLVETSGHYLDMQGKVDTRAQAPGGKTGTLLLDPSDIYIAYDSLAAFYGGMLNGAPELGDAAGLFLPSGAVHDSLLTTGALQTALLTNNVTIKTANAAGTGDGSIHVISPLAWATNRSLTLEADRDIRLKAAIAAPDAAISLKAGGTIVQTTSPADGMTAKSLGALAAGDIVLDNGGNTISGAATLASGGGNVTLSGASINLGNSSASGTLTASAANGNLAVTGTVNAGGNVVLSTQRSGDYRITNTGSVTSGAGIELKSGKMTLAGGSLTAQSVLLESGNGINLGATGNPADTLALTGSDLASVHAGQLQVAVAANHIGDGDIVASAPVSFAGTLALTAQRNIDLQAGIATGGLTLSAPNSISAGGAVAVDGTFNLLSGQWSQSIATLPSFSAKDFRLSGGSFLRTRGGNGSGDTPFALVDIYGLQGIATLAASNSYALDNNIDASGTSLWNGGAGFKPIGNSDYTYTGAFKGNGNTVTGLVINRPDIDNVGLFGYFAGSVSDLKLSGGSVRGRMNVGALVGSTNGADGYISNVQTSVPVSGIGNVGGLAGYSGAQIVSASSSGAVTAGFAVESASNIGGLVGYNFGSISGSHSSASVTTTGQGYAGGLVGANYSVASGRGSIDGSYAIGNVSSSGEIIGGLVGDNVGGAISESYASGSVQGGRNVGGLVGRNTSGYAGGGTLQDVYASGAVSAHANPDQALQHANMGGLLGENFSGTVVNAFSSSTINGSGFSSVYGLIGSATGGTVTHGYFDSVKAGTSSDAGGLAGGKPLTTAQTMQQSSFEGFSFTTSPVWRIYEGHTTPLLKGLLKPLTVAVTGSGATKVYDGNSAAFTGSGAYTGLLDGDTAASGTLGWDGARNVGTYGIGGLWSTKYDISYTGSAPLTITPRTVTAQVGGSKVYDGNTTLSVAKQSVTFANAITGDDLGATFTALFADKNAGSGKPLTVSNGALTGASAGNYVLGGATSAGAEITRAPLTVSGISGVTRVYDATVAASISGTLVASGVSGDDIGAALAGNYTFNNKNAGEGKAINVPLTLSGGDAGNYLPYTTAHGSITPAMLGITSISGVSRVYNGTDTAQVANAVFSGVYSGDTVQAGTANASFNNKNVGTGKTITLYSMSLGGADGGNYFVNTESAPAITASITPAALTVGGISANSRTYNGGTGASLSFMEGGYLVGAFNGDSVALNAGSASGAFADKNVGTGKSVTVSGLALTGTDAGNYTVAAPALSADISQLNSVSWIGGATGLWSDGANWYGGAVPDGGNVLNVILGGGSGSVVTYDGGTTLLRSLTASNGQGLTIAGGALTLGKQSGDASAVSGTVSLNSGSLNLAGSLGAGSYVQSGGALGGSGNLAASAFNMSGGTIAGLGTLAVATQYTQTGGTIATPGNIIISQASGNLSVGAISALEAISLTAQGGAITQTGALSTNSLHTVSASGTALDNSANHVRNFSGSNGASGGISLHNVLSGSDELGVGNLNTVGGGIGIDNVGGIHTTGDLRALGGAVSLAAHSPVLVSHEIAADSINLSASTGITLAGSSELLATHDIGLSAGTGVQLGGVLSSTAGSIGVTTQSGNITAASGTSVSSSGPVRLTSLTGSVSVSSSAFAAGTVPTIYDGAAAAAEAAAKAAAEAAAKAAAEAAAKAAAEAAAKAAAEAAAKAAAEAAAKAAAEAAAKAAAEAAAKAAAEAAAKAAAEAAAKAAADAAAKAAADAAAKAAADAAAEAAAKAAADAAAKAAADAAAKAAADAAAEAAAKAAAEAAAKAAADAAAKAAADAAAKAAADAAAKAAADAAAAAAQNNPTQPVGQAINSTVNIINASTSGTSASNSAPPLPASTATDKTSSSSGGTATTQAGESKKDDGKKEEGKDSSALVTAQKEPAKKMYCN